MHPSSYDVLAVNLDPQADNRIHDDEVARRYGFSGALVPGVELFAVTSAPFVAAWGEAWLRQGRLALRFRKPVYDAERLTVRSEGTGPYDVALLGPDTTVRAGGSAEPPVERPLPPLLSEAPLPAELAAAPQVGPFGTVADALDPLAPHYARRVGDASPLYDELVHPGLLVRAVNLALMRNVVLDAWIHTASDCRLLGLARLDEPLSVRSEVREVFARRGHSYLRYTAQVLAQDRLVAEVDSEAIWRLAA